MGEEVIFSARIGAVGVGGEEVGPAAVPIGGGTLPWLGGSWVPGR